VPIVALLAIPLVFRRLLAVSLALVGAFLGFVTISLTMPLGRGANQLGPNVAAGLVGGAVVGALVGVVLDALRPRSEPRDASVAVVGCAMGFGVLGAIVGGFAPSLRGGSPALSVAAIGTIAVGGGIGWLFGATIGWRLARHAPQPGRVQRWILCVAAMGIALFGASIVAAIQARQFGPSIDRITRAERGALPLVAALYCIDVAIAVSTVLAAAARGIVPMAPPTGAGAVARSGS